MPPRFPAHVADDEARQVHWCRMGLLGVAVLHWVVFYLLTQTAPRADASWNFTRMRSRYAHSTRFPSVSCAAADLTLRVGSWELEASGGPESTARLPQRQ
jgi:hypothetical protein